MAPSFFDLMLVAIFLQGLQRPAKVLEALLTIWLKEAYSALY
jgi:hypothetical protein